MGSGVSQCALRLENEADKRDRLCSTLLNDLDFRQMVVFTQHAQCAIALDKYLNEQGYPSIAAHSSCIDPSKDVDARVQRFAEFEKRILIADGRLTSSFNVGNRVDVVVNFDMPLEGTQYLRQAEALARVESGNSAAPFRVGGLVVSFSASASDEIALAHIREHLGPREIAEGLEGLCTCSA